MEKKLLFLIAALCLLLLTACGGEKTLVGTWQIMSVVAEGETIDTKSDEATVVFGADGSYLQSHPANTGEWEITEEGVIMLYLVSPTGEERTYPAYYDFNGANNMTMELANGQQFKMKKIRK
ncbi:MAG: hypothetical protein FWF85_05285 [Clostridiales bacterium]|nr:hypothetical protein [Clostridiales bacterium]